MYADFRYKFQPWYIKLYRHVRYQPIGWCAIAYNLIKWVLYGAKPYVVEPGWYLSRSETANHIITCGRSYIHFDMGKWSHTAEILEELSKNMETIDSFLGEYRFLSNFYPARVVDEYSNEYPSVEHAFQAMKTLDVESRKPFMNESMTPGQAKRMGRTLSLRDDWDTARQEVMYRLLKQKFAQEPLRTQLLQTGDAQLIEGNTWNDTTWGVCNGIGLNLLGQLLMKVREELQ